MYVSHLGKQPKGSEVGGVSRGMPMSCGMGVSRGSNTGSQVWLPRSELNMRWVHSGALLSTLSLILI